MSGILNMMLARGGAAAASPALVANAIAGAIANDDNVTTSGINTTGANLIVIAAVWYNLTTAEVTISDSNGNTWTALTGTTTPSGNVRVRMYYCVSPIVGSGHTFTSSGTDCIPAIAVQAWSNMSVSSPFDQQNGASNGSAATLALGNILPTQANSIAFGAAGFNGSRSFSSVDLSYTASDSISHSGNHFGLVMVYKVFTSAINTNPTVTLSGTAAIAGRQANFKY